MAFGTPSSSSTCDVFLSFKGFDTLYGFTGTLCNALREREINTFIDRSCEEGEEITPASTEAIEECKIAIIVLSINYAFSRSCLDELVYILERSSKERHFLVIPVFYNLDPSDVRKQRGSYGEALAKHQQSLQHNMDKFQKWKKALSQVAGICGFHFKEQEYGYEYKCIDSIVERVSDRMNLDLSQVGKIFNVGHVDGVHMLGFGRIDGIGKTTLAPGVYNLIVGHFDGSCFIQKNVREKLNKYLDHIQSIHLSKIVGEKEINLASGHHQLETGFGRTDLFHLVGFRSRSSNYDVFLSFRGEDTRYKFSGNLYNALHKIGIRTFFDEDELEIGEEITPTLLKAIQESRMAIIVLSKDYASSSFCLDELATILHCAISTGLTVIPVFYNVDPSVVGHLNDSYGEALAKHEERFKANKKKLENWKMSLGVIADLSGYRFNDGDGYEHEFISRIVDSVSSRIEKPIYVTAYPVGLLSQVQELMKLLDVESDDSVHIIGIHGMGGIGKSTLARAAYNYLLAQDFDFFCYLEDVRHNSKKYGLQHLQSILLSNILGDKNINITSVAQGISMMEKRLRRKKVLLLIDDVDHIDQLDAIVGRTDWFGLGSRVIITTRDKHLLTRHEVRKTYEVQELNEKDALQLLTWNAFKMRKADSNYSEVLNRVVEYASGLPLALKVIGSRLCERSIKEWQSAMERYTTIPDAHILDPLKVSFDALEREEKNVFLDIVCCFEGYKLQEVKLILNALYGHNVAYHIRVLVDKSLIKVNPDGRVKIHVLIQGLGREIVRMGCPRNPGKRRILWSQNDIIEVLQDNTGTDKIEIIYLDVPVSDEGETIEWNGEAFMKMKNLKVLIIKNGKFSEGPKCLPSSLRVLEWWGYPSHSLPSDFQRQNLVICKLFDHFFHPVP